eukprot:TRINITY_DN14658_c0_g1_i1.p1 TRINITY_DN14658_c0_g1~~TRINITY_DN14658_c0_g1_i1.p1  ORF type:complete len:455 (+),score=160.11 TRINITY_DN14658_c0_g1_i1:97-1461(+)
MRRKAALRQNERVNCSQISTFLLISAALIWLAAFAYFMGPGSHDETRQVARNRKRPAVAVDPPVEMQAAPAAADIVAGRAKDFDFASPGVAEYYPTAGMTPEEVSRGSAFLNRYKQMHAASLDPSNPASKKAKFVVFNPPQDGFGNRIGSAIGVFFFAVLTNRTFLMNWKQPLDIESVFDSPNIDWSYTKAEEAGLFKDRISVPHSWNGQSVVRRAFENEDLDAYFPDDIMMVTTNDLVYNNLIKSTRAQEIARREFGNNLDAYGPVSRFLCRPKENVMQVVREIEKQLFADDAFTVCIHWRTGFDDPGDYQWFRSDQISPMAFDMYQRIQGLVNKTDSRPWRIYLSSDADAVKQEFFKHAGKQHIVQHERPVRHLTKSGGIAVEGFRDIIVDHVMIGACHRSFVTAGSTFSIAAVGRTSKHETTLFAGKDRDVIYFEDCDADNRGVQCFKFDQ